MTKQQLALAAMLISSAGLPNAFAQDTSADSPYTVSANIAFTSDYRFRGVSFSNGDFAVQGGFDVSHRNGLYAGVWASSIEEYAPTILIDASGIPALTSGAESEVDLYGGYSFAAGALSFDLGAIGYFYPDSDDTTYYELTGSVSGGVRSGTLTGGVAWVPDQDNAGGDNLYLYTDFGAPIGDTGFSFSAHLGYTDGAFVFSGDDQLDWAAGLSTTLAGLDLSATYVATDADTDFDGLGLDPATVDRLEEDAEDLYGHTVVFTVSTSF